MKRVDLVYFNAGGGHRAAATALSEILNKTHPEWEVRCVNLTEIFDKMLIGILLEELYNKLIRKGWTYGLSHGLKLLHGLIRVNHRVLVNTLYKHWTSTQPDMVVSLIPNFNRCLYTSVLKFSKDVSYVTILTDIADYPPHFWMEPKQNQYFICGSEKAVEQAKNLGYVDNVFQTSGMILRPDFYSERVVDRMADRHNLGFDDSPIGIVLFGGQGSQDMITIAKNLSHHQLILVCGHNKALAEKLRNLDPDEKHLILGFVSDVEYYMELSDYFIGKPGPGSVSEAIQKNLPVVTFRNRSTMPQERYNIEWLENKDLGVVSSLSGIETDVQVLLSRKEWYNKNVSAVDNRAIFEIPLILAKILNAR